MYELSIFLAGHFLADFPLQPRHMLEDKAHAFETSLGTLTLVAHAVIQATCAAIVAGWLGSPAWYTIALIVGVTHFLIDAGKIRGHYGVMTDQILHYAVFGGVVWLL